MKTKVLGGAAGGGAAGGGAAVLPGDLHQRDRHGSSVDGQVSIQVDNDADVEHVDANYRETQEQQDSFRALLTRSSHSLSSLALLTRSLSPSLFGCPAKNIQSPFWETSWMKEFPKNLGVGDSLPCADSFHFPSDSPRPQRASSAKAGWAGLQAADTLEQRRQAAHPSRCPSVLRLSICPPPPHPPAPPLLLLAANSLPTRKLEHGVH